MDKKNNALKMAPGVLASKCMVTNIVVKLTVEML